MFAARLNEMAAPQHKRIQGYEGPTGAYAVVGQDIVPLYDPEAIIALTDGALLASLGMSPKAAEYEQIAQDHGTVKA